MKRVQVVTHNITPSFYWASSLASPSSVLKFPVQKRNTEQLTYFNIYELQPLHNLAWLLIQYRQFSNDCRKTKTKFTTLANHKRLQTEFQWANQTRSHRIQLTWSARKRMRASEPRLFLVWHWIGWCQSGAVFVTPTSVKTGLRNDRSSSYKRNEDKYCVNKRNVNEVVSYCVYS